MNEITNIAITEIIPGDNDRTSFDEVKLMELADSIKQHGLFQPITVRHIDETDFFEIVAGERRFRACKLVGMTEIPAIIRDLTNEEASAIMLSENVARAELDPVDEAIGYDKRMKAFGWSVQDCADKAGVSTTRVHFRLRLLNLRVDLLDLVRSGNLTLGYAQIIASTGLDTNFQLLAIRELQSYAKPTPGWFRNVCSKLLTKQAQGKMFDDPLFSGMPGVIPQPREVIEPAHPSNTKPPKVGKTMNEIIENQISFWTSAAIEWANIGKPFKRQECQSAALALEFLKTT